MSSSALISIRAWRLRGYLASSPPHVGPYGELSSTHAHRTSPLHWTHVCRPSGAPGTVSHAQFAAQPWQRCPVPRTKQQSFPCLFALRAVPRPRRCCGRTDRGAPIPGRQGSPSVRSDGQGSNLRGADIHAYVDLPLLAATAPHAAAGAALKYLKCSGSRLVGAPCRGRSATWQRRSALEGSWRRTRTYW